LDNNGALSKVEFHLFSNPLKDETIKNSVIDEALSHVDTNKDGKLDLDEYLADWYQAVRTNFFLFIRKLFKTF
jgi:Ca2+-binding EF-hand superfamily protein